MDAKTPFSSRCSIRLPGYDYRNSSAYFITLVTLHRNDWFGTVQNDQVILSDIGKIVSEEWLDLPNRFSWVTLDEFVVMPNHFHGICILENDPATPVSESKETLLRSNSLGVVIGQFKSRVTKRVWSNPAWQKKILWQRNYYDHILRNEEDWAQVQQYIQANPYED